MALGILRAKEAVPALARLLEEDSEPFVRSQAAVALGQIGEKSALPAVEAARHADPQRDVKHQCELAAYAVHSEFINRPAVVIVDREGIVRFAYHGSYWGDRPSIKETLEMLRAQKFEFIHPKRLPRPAAEP